MKTFKKDKLTAEIYENRTLMGEAAAKDITLKILNFSVKFMTKN